MGRNSGGFCYAPQRIHGELPVLIGPVLTISFISVIASSQAGPAPAHFCLSPSKVNTAAICSNSRLDRRPEVIPAQSSCPLTDCKCNYAECIDDGETEDFCEDLYNKCEDSGSDK